MIIAGRCIEPAVLHAVYNRNDSANELLDRKMRICTGSRHDCPHFHIALVQDISPNCDCHGENDAASFLRTGSGMCRCLPECNTDCKQSAWRTSGRAGMALPPPSFQRSPIRISSGKQLHHDRQEQVWFVIPLIFSPIPDTYK